MQFLYEKLNNFSEMGGLKESKENLPGFLVSNLNPAFELREYQKEAFARFLHCFNNEFEGKQAPLHLLFNMATGSGKTLIMAGLILYLCERGYNNFLFFVNSTNIIEKTKDNFLNNLSQKYLFNKKIVFNNKEVKISPVSNFEASSQSNINICFTTIQKLHTDLLNQKENSLTLEDFRTKKIVLIADEAHHLQVQTRQQARQREIFEKPNWENTVEAIFKQNSQNLLLEFTATMDFLSQEIATRYQNKTIIKYDLKSFRNDKFSKDVELLHTDTGKEERILQAIILSQYRAEVALKYGIDLKPVVLFRAQKTIAQSQENKKLFETIIENLSKSEIEKIRQKSNVEVLQKAFKFFTENKITDAVLVEKLKIGFAKNKTLSVNEDKDKEQHQLLLNSLEDKNNQIRAIFAVQKLNEGWDVLNLFDIARMYETRDGGHGRIGKTTISEAQLIGRGARYFPFVLSEADDKYKRKFDSDLNNELRILEELHYHHYNEPRYISEIKEALTREGIYDEKEIEIQLCFKDFFTKTDFYKTGKVFSNKKIKRNFERVKTIEGLGVKNKNIVYKVLSGKGLAEAVFTASQMSQEQAEKAQAVSRIIKRDVSLQEISSHIVKGALVKNDFFAFNSLKKYFPKLKSQNEFILSANYLAGFCITFEGLKSDLDNLSSKEKLNAVLSLLSQIEKEIKSGLTEYQGSVDFTPCLLKDAGFEKKVKTKANYEANEGFAIIRDSDWYPLKSKDNFALPLTDQERGLVEFIAGQIDFLKKKYKDVYLLRNERQLKLYNFGDGAGFEPDFILFLQSKNNKQTLYQLFIEPKGEQMIGGEQEGWKDEFSQAINKNIFIRGKKYKIIGLPFYNQVVENKFKEKFLKVL